MTKAMTTFLHKAGASVLFTGYFPFASGTIGSAVAIGTIWLLHRQLPLLFAPESAPIYWLAMLAGTAVSFALCAKASENFGNEDPSQIVFDEFVGQWITFFMIPITWRTLALGFLLFRFFDVVKPFPVYRMEEIEGGVGVTLDDVFAGILANVSLAAVLFLFDAVNAWL